MTETLINEKYEDRREIKETLKKQLQLLSERSEKPDSNLPELSDAMAKIALLIVNLQY